MKIQFFACLLLLGSVCRAQTVHLTPPTIGAFHGDIGNGLISIGSGARTPFISYTREATNGLYISGYAMTGKWDEPTGREFELDFSDFLSPDIIYNYKQTGYAYGVRLAHRAHAGRFHFFEASFGLSRMSTNFNYGLITEDWGFFSGIYNTEYHSVGTKAIENYVDLTPVFHACNKKGWFDFYFGFSLAAGHYELLKVKDTRLESGSLDGSGYMTVAGDLLSGIDLNFNRFYTGIQFKHGNERPIWLDANGHPTFDPEAYELRAVSTNLTVRAGMTI